MGGYAIAGDYCQEALAIARAAGDDYLVADLLHVRAWILLRQGSPAPRCRSSSRAWAWPAASGSPPDRAPAFCPGVRHER